MKSKQVCMCVCMHFLHLTFTARLLSRPHPYSKAITNSNTHNAVARVTDIGGRWTKCSGRNLNVTIGYIRQSSTINSCRTKHREMKDREHVYMATIWAVLCYAPSSILSQLGLSLTKCYWYVLVLQLKEVPEVIYHITFTTKNFCKLQLFAKVSLHSPLCVIILTVCYFTKNTFTI